MKNYNEEMMMNDTFLQLLATDKEIDGHTKVDAFDSIMKDLRNVDISIDTRHSMSKRKASTSYEHLLMDLLSMDQLVDKQKPEAKEFRNENLMDDCFNVYAQQHAYPYKSKQELEQEEYQLLSNPTFMSLIFTDVFVDNRKKKNQEVSNKKNEKFLSLLKDVLTVDQEIDLIKQGKDSTHCALQAMLDVDVEVDKAMKYNMDKQVTKQYRSMKAYDVMLAIDQKMDGCKTKKIDESQAYKAILAIDEEIDALQMKTLKPKSDDDTMKMQMNDKTSSKRRTIFTKKEKTMASTKKSSHSQWKVIEPLLDIDRFVDGIEQKKKKKNEMDQVKDLLKMDILMDDIKSHGSEKTKAIKSDNGNEDTKTSSVRNKRSIFTKTEKSMAMESVNFRSFGTQNNENIFKMDNDEKKQDCVIM